jgi:outer membrane protein assembly factor BamB
VRSELAADPGWRRRFAREVAAVRAVNPLFTAAVVDADTEAAEPWFATTYIDGPSLSVLVGQTGPLAPSAVLVLASGLAEALADIHRAGLVHRDLKPSNVIINDEGPHIIDFGIALTAETPATTSMLLGTPSYIAPERIHGSEANPASDIFSLGASLVFASTGKPLVTEGPVYAQLMQITTGRFDLSAVPPDLRPLIVRCVSHAARDRPTAEELSRILTAARVPGPAPGWYNAVGPVKKVPLVPLPPRFSRRRLLAVGGLVGAAAATSSAAWLLPERAPARVSEVLPTPTPTTPPPPPPPVPGDVVWMASSGADPVVPSPGNPTKGSHILVDAQRLIAAHSGEVFAVSPLGRPLWRQPLPAGVVTLRRWGDGVLVNDPQRIWYLDAASGDIRFLAEVVAEEQAGFADDNDDNYAVQVNDIAVADYAFASLGTATIALDRKGAKVWRTPRPPRPGVDVRPAAGGPAAANGTWLLTHNSGQEQVQAALRQAGSGETRWNVQYPVSEPNDPPGPPAGGPPGGPGGGGGGLEEDMMRPEGLLVDPYVVLRDQRQIRVLSLSSGRTAWRYVSPTPVAQVQVVGPLLLISADRVTAHALNNGSQRWQGDVRKARVAATLDGALIIAAGDGVIAALDGEGAAKWRTPVPNEFAGAIVDEVTVDEHTAYVTFKSSGSPNGPRITLTHDVLAVALDAQAQRH